MYQKFIECRLLRGATRSDAPLCSAERSRMLLNRRPERTDGRAGRLDCPPLRSEQESRLTERKIRTRPPKAERTTGAPARKEANKGRTQEADGRPRTGKEADGETRAN